jgi:hypothetical protein
MGSSLNQYTLPRAGAMLLVAACALVLSSSVPIPVAHTVPNLRASLVQTIDTSAWHLSSPSPSNVTYWPDHDTLMISDGEA